jgi:hypothetical protein
MVHCGQVFYIHCDASAGAGAVAADDDAESN